VSRTRSAIARPASLARLAESLCRRCSVPRSCSGWGDGDVRGVVARRRRGQRGRAQRARNRRARDSRVRARSASRRPPPSRSAPARAARARRLDHRGVALALVGRRERYRGDRARQDWHADDGDAGADRRHAGPRTSGLGTSTSGSTASDRADPDPRLRSRFRFRFRFRFESEPDPIPNPNPIPNPIPTPIPILPSTSTSTTTSTSTSAISADELLMLSASAELASEHPIARGEFVDGCPAGEDWRIAKPESLEVTAGGGVTATIAGRVVKIGTCLRSSARRMRAPTRWPRRARPCASCRSTARTSA